MIIKNGYAYEELENEIGIYLPGEEGWFRYALRHIVKPYTDGGIHQNQDLWRLHKLTLWKREGDEFSPVYDFPITNAGEWECAVKIEGTPDFHGGFHGYEHLTRFEFIPEEDSFYVLQDSVIYLQGSRDDRIATHRKEYRFRDGVLSLHQIFSWERDFEINRAFLTMLPIRRKEGDFLINDTALYKGEEYDISCEGHSTPLSPGHCKESVQEITTTGKVSGVTATVTASFKNSFSIQNTSEYNKLYFAYTRKSKVFAGDVWETDSTFRFTYKTPQK